MMTRLSLIATALLLAGCTEVMQSANVATSNTAKRVVTQSIFTGFPDIPKQLTGPAADCVIANATIDEKNALAGDAVTGIGEATTIRVNTILSRPATNACLQQAATARGITL
jgi:hypothetical protein